tara:strand:- start:1943 stop:4378 length:2436 start_codon:yes stop_codon:yes gene_type:complete
MIELKEFNPLCMTETNRSRATQQNENYSVLQTNNESELSNMLITLSSKVDIVTNLEQAKTMILTDTRKDLDQLISQIRGQTQTIDAIRSKQSELESAVSSLMELKKQFSESSEESTNIDLSLAIREQELMILTLNREIKNLKKISDIFGSTVEEENQETDQTEVERVKSIMNDENQKARLLSILKNQYITKVLPINDTYRVKLVELLESNDFSSEKLILEMKKAFEHYEQNLERSALVRILEHVGLRELIRSAKENIYIFLVTILRFDFTVSAESTIGAITSLTTEFASTVGSLVRQDNIENRILRRQQTSINNEIKRINPNGATLSMNQIRNLTSLPLRELQRYCEAHPQNTACLVIKRMITQNKEAILQRIIEKVNQSDRYTDQAKQRLIQKIQCGQFDFERLRFSTLLAFVDNQEDGQFWDQMQGTSVYYAANVGRVYSRAVNIGILATESRSVLKNITLSEDLTLRSKLGGNTNELLELLESSNQPHRTVISDFDKSVREVCDKNQVNNRNAVKEATKRAAKYKLELQAAYEHVKSLPTSTERTKLLRIIEGRLIELQNAATRLNRARYGAVGDFIETTGAGRRLDNISGHSSRMERLFNNRLTKTVTTGAKWALINGILCGAPQVYNVFTGQCNTTEALRNTASTMRYCIPVYGTYLSWRDFANNPSFLGGITACCSTVLDVAGLPLKIAGIAGRLGFGLIKTTGLNTVLRAASSTATKVLFGSIGGSLLLDYMLQEDAGTSAGTALQQSYNILGIGGQLDDYLEMSPLERLEDEVMGEIEYQVQSLQSFESSDQYSRMPAAVSTN